MAVCYVETFVLQNACVDAGLLWLAAAWRGGRIKPLKILTGGLFGGLWALAAAIAGGLMRTIPMQVLISIVMVWLGIKPATGLEYLKSAGVLWLGALVLGGGTALGLSPFAAGIATGFGCMAMIRRKNAPPPPTVMLFIRHGEVTRRLEAVIDTGNRALDPMTGLPAVFVPQDLFETPEGRALYIRTAAGERMLPCFMPDMLTVDGIEVRAVVACAPQSLLDHALVPWVLCVGGAAS